MDKQKPLEALEERKANVIEGMITRAGGTPAAREMVTGIVEAFDRIAAAALGAESKREKKRRAAIGQHAPCKVM